MSAILRLIPFVLMFILYLAIFLKLKSQRGPGEHSMNAQIQRLRRERNALKLSIAIVLGFAVCWIPFSIFALVRMFADENNATMSCGFKQLLEQVKNFFRLMAKFLGRFNA